MNKVKKIGYWKGEHEKLTEELATVKQERGQFEEKFINEETKAK